MRQNEHDKAIEQFSEFQKEYLLSQPSQPTEIPSTSSNETFLSVMDPSNIFRLTNSEMFKVHLSRSYGHMGYCFRYLNNMDEAFKSLDKCLSFYNLDFVNMDGMKLDEFQYYMLIVISLISYKYQNIKYLKKYFKILIEPKPRFESMSQGFRKCNNENDIPQYFRMMNSYWPKLKYAHKKRLKRDWRLFKNTAFINSHVRRAFLQC